MRRNLLLNTIAWSFVIVFVVVFVCSPIWLSVLFIHYFGWLWFGYLVVILMAGLVLGFHEKV